MLYLLLAVGFGMLFYVALRATRERPRTRVIGPDDDPEFLWRISHGDNQP
ncbi:hypothetical protein MU0083_000473 [[Mycobacterium] kokjensenii]|uniref:Uncharacterized protein n=1 Tax=[Mycobacterium] kokjensenii TaxID=3064287 RepID=A0ABM9L774_9MYCO|nr:hypothetical protein [Mycolicibacter sp. MU0083]CAJ1493748.1 hypothetical protein MU0083_000473 [Mycolicibacter sp. MU0083]